MPNLQHVWETTLVNLEGEIPARLLSTWVRPLEPLRLENEALVLRCPNRFARDWVRARTLTITGDGRIHSH